MNILFILSCFFVLSRCSFINEDKIGTGVFETTSGAVSLDSDNIAFFYYVIDANGDWIVHCSIKDYESGSVKLLSSVNVGAQSFSNSELFLRPFFFEENDLLFLVVDESRDDSSDECDAFRTAILSWKYSQSEESLTPYQLNKISQTAINPEGNSTLDMCCPIRDLKMFDNRLYILAFGECEKTNIEGTYYLSTMDMNSYETDSWNDTNNLQLFSAPLRMGDGYHYDSLPSSQSTFCVNEEYIFVLSTKYVIRHSVSNWDDVEYFYFEGLDEEFQAAYCFNDPYGTRNNEVTFIFHHALNTRNVYILKVNGSDPLNNTKLINPMSEITFYWNGEYQKFVHELTPTVYVDSYSFTQYLPPFPALTDLYVVWGIKKFNTIFHKWKVYYLYSTDDGNTFDYIDETSFPSILQAESHRIFNIHGTTRNKASLDARTNFDVDVFYETTTKLTEIDVPIRRIVMAMDLYSESLPSSNREIYIKSISYSICPRGLFYSNATSDIGVCVRCSDSVSFQSSMTFGDETSSCITCPIGTYPDPETFTDCFNCSHGTFSSQAIITAAQCTSCAPGTYSENYGVTDYSACIPCLNGTYNPFEGQSSPDACLECDAENYCPDGSNYQLKDLTEINEVEYSENLYNDVTRTFSSLDDEFYLNALFWKLMFALFMSVLCCLLLLLLFCTTLIIPDKDDLPPTASAMMKVLRFFHFKYLDWYFAESHEVEEDESPVRKRTCAGGMFSVCVVFLGVTLIAFSFLDFILDNVYTMTKMQLYLKQVTKGDFVGDYELVMNMKGEFTSSQCRSDLSSINYVGTKGFNGVENGVLSCGLSSLGCKCVWKCEDCDIYRLLQGTIPVFNIYVGGILINYIDYSVSVPNVIYDGDLSFQSKGTITSTSDSINELLVELNVLPTQKSTWSRWNYVTAIFGIEDIYRTKTGLAAPIKTVDKVTGSLSLYTDISFQFSISDMMIIDEEKPDQGLLNFVAQIFALFGLSITLIGVLYGPIDRFALKWQAKREERRQEKMEAMRILEKCLKQVKLKDLEQSFIELKDYRLSQVQEEEEEEDPSKEKEETTTTTTTTTKIDIGDKKEDEEEKEKEDEESEDEESESSIIIKRKNEENDDDDDNEEEEEEEGNIVVREKKTSHEKKQEGENLIEMNELIINDDEEEKKSNNNEEN